MENIKRATAVYSGGGIYLYYAELENKQWIMGNDDWLIIVNANPIENKQIFENSGYYEWQLKHLVKEIPEEEYQEVLNNIIDVILDGKTIEEYDNFSKGDLKDRYAGL